MEIPKVVHRYVLPAAGAAATALALLTEGPPPEVEAREPVHVEEVAPGFHRIHNNTGSLLVWIGDDEVFVSGAQNPELVTRARAFLRDRGAPPVRYALSMEHADYESHADGGWAAEGAITVTHEMLYADMRRLRRVRERTETPLTGLGELPMVGFSHVVQLFRPGEEIHIVHPRPGTSWSDVLVHFHRSGLTFLGSIYTADGYPEIHPERGASIPGIVQTLDFFLENFAGSPHRAEPIVPARGAVGTLAELREYREMLAVAYRSVKPLVDGGLSVEEIVAARPTAELDARWGNGPVTPDRFVAAIAESIREGAAAAPHHHH